MSSRGSHVFLELELFSGFFQVFLLEPKLTRAPLTRIPNKEMHGLFVAQCELT
jgi:hypothetical protein